MTLWMGMAARQTLGPMTLMQEYMLISVWDRILIQVEKGKGNLWRDCKESNTLCSRTQFSAKKYLSS